MTWRRNGERVSETDAADSVVGEGPRDTWRIHVWMSEFQLSEELGFVM